ncbi:MAG: TIGR02646 family protein [Lachnospiraceae bacterium]|nr:TIGR02646 family protein [Lachnospiraceae bacterium]
MLYIQKGKEPVSLTRYKKQKHAYFDGFPEKDDIRERLLEEQGYLCAYCMRRIDIRHMKIEHWYSENKLSDAKRLDYRNMLGSCIGHIDGTDGKKADTCDAAKKGKVIVVNPQDKSTLRTIKYRSSGEIYSEDKVINGDINETLNLNSKEHLLILNRKQLLRQVIAELSDMQNRGIWGKRILERVKQKYMEKDGMGRKKEYAGVAIWYIDRKLKNVN